MSGNFLRYHKRRGEWVELQFMARAAAHGLTVSKPWGDSSPYDFIVETKGTFFRVQVKSTILLQGEAYRCNIRSRVKLYTKADIDFLACYVVPEDLWYIIPRAETVRAKSRVFLNPYSRTNSYFRYLEAWHLLKKRC